MGESKLKANRSGDHVSIAAFTGGISVPSGRFRLRQYIPTLREHNIDVVEYVSKFGAYPPRSNLLRPLWAVCSLAERIPGIVKSHGYDAVLLQREMLSTFVTLEGLTRRPRILDVDDAIFLYKQGTFARKMAELCDRVICGNSYLADWFSQWNRDVCVIPTAVDSDRYVPKTEKISSDKDFVIGWIGTSGNLQYLAAIEGALAKVVNCHPAARLLVVSNQPPRLRCLSPGKVDFIPWSEAIEVQSIQRMDVGIMPLTDSQWARGKCSFKMLQYMSCGIPVIVSPVGMNAEVLSMGEIGLKAETDAQWVDAMSVLLENEKIRAELGRAGRELVQRNFSVRALAPVLSRALKGY